MTLWIVSAIGLLLLGVALGFLLAIGYAGSWALNDRSRRRAALAEAERRVDDAHATALNRLADAAASFVYAETAGPSSWPSEDVIDVQVVRQEPRA